MGQHFALNVFGHVHLQGNVFKIAQGGVGLVFDLFAGLLEDHRLASRVDLGEGVAEGLGLRSAPLAADLVQLGLGVGPHIAPVERGCAAQRSVNGLQVIQQAGASIQKALFAGQRDLKAQAQGTLDGETVVAKIVVVEDFAGGAGLQGAVLAHDVGDVRLVGELAALVAQAAAQRLPTITRIHQLNPATAARLFAVGDDPDVGADAGVVEHLLGHGDDGFEPVVFDHPFADVALARAGAAGEQRRTVEDDGQARAVFAGFGVHRLHLAEHVLQEQQCAVVDPRRARAKAADKALLVVFAHHFLLLALPIHAKGWVGQEVVEALAEKLIVHQRVSELYVGGFWVFGVAAHQQVRRCHRIGALVEVLAVHIQPRAQLVIAKVVARFGKHAASAASRVQQGAHGVGLGQQIIVVHEQQADHQLNNLARGEVVTCRFIGLLVEAPDQVFKQQAHLEVVHRVGVQIDLAELAHHQEQDIVLVQPFDLVAEVEVIKDALDIL